MFEVSSLPLVCVVFLSLKFFPASRGLFALVTGTAVLPDEECSLVGLKYTYFYLRSVKIVSGLIFRIFY